MPAEFESLFAKFIETIGGEVIPESAVESADSLFRSENVAAELKILKKTPAMHSVRSRVGFSGNGFFPRPFIQSQQKMRSSAPPPRERRADVP